MATEARVRSYLEQIKALHPRGVAHVIPPDSTREKVWLAIAAILASVEDRATDLEAESWPGATLELLPDWERVTGLPSDCSAEFGSTDKRRSAILATLAGGVGTSLAELMAFAAKLGFTVRIVEHRPFEVGISTVGDGGTLDTGEEFREGRLYEGEDVLSFTVHAPVGTPFFFECGVSSCDEPLMDVQNALLSCELRSVLHAHTYAFFVFDDDYTGWAPWTDIYPDPTAAAGAVPFVQRG